MTDWPIARPLLTYGNASKNSPVHTCMIRMELKASKSVVERLKTVYALNYAILALIPYENTK